MEVFSKNAELKQLEECISELEQFFGQKERKVAVLRFFRQQDLSAEDKVELVEDH